MRLVDMVSGEATAATVIANRRVNGIGYNVVDDFIYGWDFETGQIVRVDANWNVQNLGIPAGMTAPFGGLTGDVDENGHLWLTGQGGTGRWHQIDLATMTHLASGDIEGGGVENFTGGPDWAHVPEGGNYLYRVMRTSDSAEAVLFRFDKATGQHENLGSFGDLGGTNTFGAVYADAAGFLYASNNATGDIFRIDIDEVTATLFTEGPPSANNDGARCFDAPILLDFGDAPDSYGTLLASNGPRHELRDFEPDPAFTTSLMLGIQVDPEDDGMPGPDADGDNFDDGVADPILFLAGEPTTVTVTVTNNTDEEATLAGWIDLDGTGTFDPGDRAPLETIPPNSGTQDYVLTFPPGTAANDTYARFRVFPGVVADPLPTGSAGAGEVEDYLVLTGRVQYVKTINPDDVTELDPGDIFEYTITVTNTGSVLLTELTFTDDLSDVLDDATFVPGSLAFDLGEAVFDPIAGTIEWELDPDVLDVGAVATITFEVQIDDPVTGDGVLINSVLGDGPGSNCVDDPATDPDCFKEVPQPLLEVTKTSNVAGTVEPDDVIEYTFTVTNIGPGPANNAVVYDDLSGVLDDAEYNGDAAITPVGQGQVVFEPVNERLRWNGPLGAEGEPDDSVTITYSVTVNPADAMGDGVLQNAMITPNCPDPPIFDPNDPDFDEDCVEVTGIEAWLVVKTSEPAGNVMPGDTVSYTVEVINTGGVDLTGLSFVDDLSGVLDDAAFDIGSESADIGTAVFDPVAETLEWSSAPDTLPVGQTATVTYSVTVNDANDLGDAVLTNAITGTPNCPVPGGEECGTVNPVEAWSVVKTSNVAGPVEPGDVVAYELTITNLGGVDLVGGDGPALEISDDLSGVLDDASYNEDEAATLGEVAYTEPILTWSGDLLIGEAALVTYSVTVNDADDLGDGILTNAVTGSPNCPDPAITDPGDPAFDPDCVSNVPTGPQLSIEKTLIAESMALDGIAEPGEELTYSIRVRNNGGTEALNVEVNEIVPDNTSYVATGSDAWSCADGSGPGTACDFVITTVPAQGFVDLLYRVQVDDPIPPGVTVIANAVALNGEDPPECPPADDPACSVTPTEPQTVISKALTGESMEQNGQAEAGEVLTYTLTLHNHGGSDDADVVINELVPEHTVTAAGNQSINGALGDWSCADGASPGTACDFTLDTIAAGETITLEFMVQVDDPIPDGVTEIANAVALNGEDPPPCPPSSPQCVITPTEPAVSVVKTLFSEDGDVDGVAEPGETLVFELVVTNSGGSTAFDEFLREIVPQYTTFLADPESSPGWDCPDGSVNPAVCDLLFEIDAGETLSFLFAVVVDDPLPDDVNLIANSIGLGGNPPPCPPAGVHCVVLPTEPDVAIVKELTGESGDVPGMAEPGEQLTYTITLTNTGGSDAVDFEVVDQLDSNVIFISADNGGALVGDNVEWAGLTVPAGGDLVLTVVVEVVDPIPAGVTEIGNVAFDPGTGPPDCEDDPEPPNCTSTPTTPEVAIVKELTGESGDVPGMAEPGEQLTYTITLTNTGGSDALDFDVVDQLDPNVIFISADNGGALAGDNVEWTGLTIPAGGDLVLTIVVEVVDPIPAGVTEIGNVAFDPGTGPPDCEDDPEPPNCTSTPTTPEVAIVKELTGESGDVPGMAEPGEQLTYTITLVNTGGSDTLDFEVVDQLDPNVIFISANNGGVHDGAVTGGQVEWSGLTIPAGGELALTVVVEVVDPIPPNVTVIGNVAYNPDVGPPDCSDDPEPPNCTSIDSPQEPLAVPIDAMWMLWLLGLLIAMAGMRILLVRLET